MSASAVFWFLAGLLCALAIVLVGWPWLRSFGTQASLSGRMPRWLPAAALVVVAAVLALYLSLGSPGQTAATSASTLPHALGDASGAATAASKEANSMEAVLASLESRLVAGGGSDADELLAKSYQFLNRTSDAALARSHQLPAGAGAALETAKSVTLTAAGQKLLEAAEAARRQRDYPKARDLYRQLVQQQQMNASSWADYADVSASLNGNSLAGEPEKYLQEALRLDPRHTKALWLQGSVEHETRRYSAATATWKLLLATMDPASSDAKLIAANIAEDQQLATANGAVGSPVASAAANAGVAVSGEVSLSDALRGKVKPGMTLYILAKSVDSPGAPVAAIRTMTGTWPVRFELNDSQAMIPGRNLSSAGKVTIEARVSLSGQAASQPGDLLGSAPALDPRTAKPLRIVIQKEVG
jgi:tetratricopeptide (TPR) repeat protein